MTRILITGVAGTGKSTLCKELKSRGFDAHDADYIEGLVSWHASDSHLKTCSCEPYGKQWLEQHIHVWDRQVIHNLLASGKNVILCGVSQNQDDFYELFDEVVLLKLDEDDERKRLRKRKNTSEFGAKQEQRDDLMIWKEEFEDSTILRGARVIDSSNPIQTIANKVISLLYN